MDFSVCMIFSSTVRRVLLVFAGDVQENVMKSLYKSDIFELFSHRSCFDSGCSLHLFPIWSATPLAQLLGPL